MKVLVSTSKVHLKLLIIVKINFCYKGDVLYVLDILFSSNHNIHKSSSGLCIWGSDPFSDRSEGKAHKQRPYKLL